MTNFEARVIGRVYGKLCEHGAASVERISAEARLDDVSVKWALARLDAEEGAGLYSLPERMIPWAGLD